MADLEGFDELLKALDEMPAALGQKRKLIVKSLRKAAAPVRDKGESNAPELTGRLKDNIGISVVDQTATGAEARIGPTEPGFYGLFEEIGTAHQLAQPWLGPAFDETVEQAVKILSDELGKGIEDAFNG